MAVESWPAGLPHGKIAFAPVGAGRTGGSAGELPAAVGVSHGGPHWTARISELSFTGQARIATARGLQMRLQGGAAPVLIPACDGGLTPQVPGGAAIAAVLNADAASGDELVNFSTSGDWRALLGGEHFSIDHLDAAAGRRLYRVIEVLDVDGGDYQVRITPGLRADALTGVALDFLTPSCPMRLVDGFDLPLDLGRFIRSEASFVEWFDRSPANQPASPPPPDPEPSTAFRFHRLRWDHTLDGDAYCIPSEIDFLDGWGGDSLGGVLMSSAVISGLLANLRDGNAASTTVFAGTGWAGVDLGEGNEAEAVEAYLRGNQPAQSSMPSSLYYDGGVLDPGDPDADENGVVWTPQKHWDQTRWFDREERYFPIRDQEEAGWVADFTEPSDSGNQWRNFRVRPNTVQAGGATFALSALGMSATVGGPNIVPDFKAGDIHSGFEVALTDVGGTAYLTFCRVYLGTGGWFEGRFGRTPVDRIAQVAMQSRVGMEGECPLDLVIEASNWAGEYYQLYRSTELPWLLGETRTVTL